MCYSARVRQKFNELASEYAAEVDWDAFEEIYKRRAEGENLKMARDLQRNFEHPETVVQERTRQYIVQYLKQTRDKWERDVFVQRARRTKAEESLATRETKKAREEIRIATSKEQMLLGWLADLRRKEPNKEDARIFPMWYAPVIAMIAGRRVIKPMRYACQLAGKSVRSEQNSLAPYNARRDNLDDYWQSLYGSKHAIMVVKGFYENVPKHLYERRELGTEEKPSNLVLEYNPDSSQDMLVACLWDHWKGSDGRELYSYAAVTDEPPQEIAETGHQRVIISLQRENIDRWLSPEGLNRSQLEEILSARQTPRYEHQIAA